MKNVSDIYALTPMQRLMLLHARTAGIAEDVLFNQIVYTISGSWDVSAYRRAWQLMVDRHPALRSIFIWKDAGEPMQVVRERAELPWVEVDWRAFSTEEREIKLEQLLQEDRADGFDLRRVPLMRLTLIRINDDRHWLVWSSHHLIIDRWSINIIFEELKIAYEAFVEGDHPHMVPAPRYRDYIAWLAAQDENEARAFWQETLHDVELRSLVQTSSTNEATGYFSTGLALEGQDATQLLNFARANDLTASTLVTAAWAIVLSTATGKEDTVLGLTVSGRPADLPAVDRTVGCFINNVPFRVNLGDDSSLLPWLHALQENQLELKSFEYVSPAQIKAWCNISAVGQLFDSLVVLQAPVHYPTPSGMDIELFRGGMQTGYPTSLGVVIGLDSLRLTLTFDRRLMPEDQASAMMAGLRDILKAMPDGRGVTQAQLRTRAKLIPLAEPAAVTIKQEPVGIRPYIPPRSTAEQAMTQIWSELLGVSPVGTEERFFDLGGDSISGLQLLSLIEQRFGKSLSINTLLSNPTVAQMSAEIGDDAGDWEVDPILLPINPGGSEPPFFYAHGVFGDISSLTNVVPQMSPDQPIYGLRAHGLHPGCEPDRTIEQMVNRYVESIRSVQPAGPYFLGGFCFGGVLAYEIARRLEQMGEKTALLAVIEGSAPRQFHNKQPIIHPQRLKILRYSGSYWLRGYQEFGGRQIGRRVKSRFGKASVAPRQLDWDAEFDNLADFNASRPDMQIQLREINRHAINGYVPKLYGGHLTLFRGRYKHLGYSLFGEIDPERGWGSLARGGVTIRYVDGSHIGLLRQPFAADLAAQLQDALRQARENSNS